MELGQRRVSDEGMPNKGEEISEEEEEAKKKKEEKNGGGEGIKEKENSNYVRADKINLADLDAALERHLNRGKTPEHERRKMEEWEIDLGKVVLKNMIARGTFGTVYKGVYDGQDVAVKLLDWGEDAMGRSDGDAVRASFRQEVAVWHKLDHPNVTKFIGASMGNGALQIPSRENGPDGFVHVASNVCCVVVEYLAGGTLKNFLIRHIRRKLSLKSVMQIALDLSRGLSYLHSQSIIHRDVKSENMLLDKKMNLKIADFGVARVEAQNPKDMTGETGTLGYMAPEVLAGKPYNRKCDVYSFGICLWEIYCCDMPYADLSFAEMTSAVVKQNLRPEIPRCCPSQLAAVMKKCWDANPDKRPTMEEVVPMLEAIDTSKGGGMIPEGEFQGCLCFRFSKGP